ncbi:MAG: putative toxin-antitoxin system toxin component, PIN family [bacterium]|nr:putative toxin-antitoxin system toxin component, PIN family [bacterium]
MRVVIDTNIFDSSFFGGKPRKIIDLWKNGTLILCLSGEILDEYVEVLNRLGVGDQEEMEDLLRLFAENLNIRFTRKTPKLQLVQEDPDDDKFIECAVALKARYVVTGDKALKAVEEYAGIKIMTPAQFLSQISF